MFRISVKNFHTTSRRFVGRSHYERLKLPFDASSAEIKNKFKKLSLKLHPDMLKSQGLSEDELNTKADEYLKIKKSYEILSDDKKRSEYDLHMGIRRTDPSMTSPNSFFRRRGNSFHFHESYKYNDVPHFDSKKHQQRNERIEKMYVYNQKINQNIDTFGRDLYARNLGANGPRKGIYKKYKYQPSIHHDEAEGKKLAMKVAGGVIGLFTLWYITCGTYSTVKPKNTNKNKTIIETKEDAPDMTKLSDAKETAKIDEVVNSQSKSGKKMNVNNSYGMMLISGGGESRDALEVIEEQISETSE